MQENTYRDQILQALKILNEAEMAILGTMVNIGMYGIYKDVHNVFEEGDEYTFNLQLFENTTDVNLNVLTDLMYEITACKEKIVNLNGVTKAEVDGLIDEEEEENNEGY